MPAHDSPGSSLAAVRDARPLVHNITNHVVMNTTANALLALGASPVMAHAPDEVEELAAMAGALVINIGTLDQPWIAAMRLAALAVGRAGRPWVLDPVGAGATGLRTRTALGLLALGPSLLRGNASEILALAGEAGDLPRGVDSTVGSEAAAEAATALARRAGCVVAVTGAVDLVTDGSRALRIANGHPMMTRVTGTGCTASALAGAFLAALPDPLAAAAHALAMLGLAGERAAGGEVGPGLFQTRLLDELYRLGPAELDEGARIS
ncbi:hydroxyethylthiazole kinase [Marinimicrococcus flavescens]|uniref:Hydroxyethylthiazole kinase n=1 Tax=Marinimicrococcus flavescens TaxID=3031815 RepID=A0AAP3V393_9PROT|nr:hydroxyethylthiazole kinase [Marinimicrococcus flavescens]